MNYSRVKPFQEQRYSEVSEQQQERNKERVDHASSILSELEERVENPTERLETAKELLSLAGTETTTEGCNTILTDCLKLMRESAEDAGLAEYYRQEMREMPSETIFKSPPEPSQERYEEDRQEERRW
jgi:hypothetical protein